ncbi:sigma-70 family RNA polymerase sigma factor [Sanguibacter suarezii]|uniref:sigma-70 family RNA polymerase sigma factor n=1 Tax=Sanguibacter suarezii TaxID=60921 RepID=UPI000AD1A0C7|nr:sigma-70 family RNA polymerase sigma factor [Sanguibacter suarezii]
MTDRSAPPPTGTAHDAAPRATGRGTGVSRSGDRTDVGDEHLIAQTRDGSGEAFEELWRRHAAAGRRVAARFTQASDPEDLVQEAYLRIYSALQNGSGPDLTFRPYLYQTIRNIAITWAGRPVEQSIAALDDISDGSDMSTTILENSVTATAFRSLPARWQSVLWYSEVEGLEPAEIAPLLGIKAGAVSALAYRAREGLRRAWLQVHVNSDAVPPECTWAAERMGDFNRGALRGATKARFQEHVDGCTRCLALVDEVNEISRKLGLVMIPIVVGVPWDTFADVDGLDGLDGADGADGVGSESSSGADVAPTPGASTGRTSKTWTGPVTVISAVLALVVIAGAWSLNGAWVGAGTTLSLSAVSPAPLPEPDPSVEGSAPEASQPVESAAPPAAQPGSDYAAGPPSGDRGPGRLLPPAVPETSVPQVLPVPSGPDGEAGPLPVLPPPPAEDPGAPAAHPPWGLDPTGPAAPVDPADPAAPPGPAVPAAPAIPTLTGPDPADPLLVYPTMTGTAEPGTTIHLEDAAGRLLAEVATAPSGEWSATIGVDGVRGGAVDPWSDALTEQATADGLTITARAVDAEGWFSAASPARGPYTMSGAQVLAPAAGAEVAHSVVDHDRNGLYDDLDIEISGLTGHSVRVYLDGATSGTVHRLGASPVSLYSAGLTLGAHTIGIQYVIPMPWPDTGVAAGPVVTHPFTVITPAQPAVDPAAQPESFIDVRVMMARLQVLASSIDGA